MDKNRARGALGEELAEHFLRDKGFEILERNWKKHPYEIDLIAREGNVLVFIEVKYRQSKSHGQPELGVNRRKAKILLDAAEEYLEIHGHEGEIRFDVMAITGGKSAEISHFRDAIIPSDYTE